MKQTIPKNQQDYFQTNTEQLHHLLTSLQERKAQLLKEISLLPTGYFHSNKNGKSNKWYVQNENRYDFLPHSQKETAKKILLREYKEKELKCIQYELDALSESLQQVTQLSRQMSEHCTKSPDYANLLNSALHTFDSKVQEWLSEPFSPNPFHPENLIHETKSGILVRSKSEVLIADMLFDHHIPFKYECPIHLNDTIFYPDFTCMTARSNRIMYWEHNGMIDNPSYSFKMQAKESTYIANGIFPSMQLISTYETKKYPLTRSTIQKMIDLYLYD